MAVPTAKDVAEHWAFVLVAYFLAFGIWTAASGNDFISSNWKSVRQTRRRGQFHVFLVFVPMIYMSAYIYYQHKIGDYKETGAASLALAFAILHLLRTIAGLWQLHMFKQWAIASIKSMESIGFVTRLPSPGRGPCPDNTDDCEGAVGVDADDLHAHVINSESANIDKNVMRDFSDSDEYSSDSSEHSPVSSESDTGITEETPPARGAGESGEVRNADTLMSAGRRCVPVSSNKRSMETEEERIERESDEILVNDSLIDNRLSDVSTTCYPQWLSKSEQNTLRQEKLPLKRLLLRVWYTLCSILRFFNIVFSLTFCKAPRLPNSLNGPRILPWNPETVWLRWAAALVAQADWVQDLDNNILPTNPDRFVDYEHHRDHFAEKILMSAALHCRRPRDGDEGGDRTIPKFLSFREWRKYPQLCRGKFSKQEFLHFACRTGSGLPYMAPHQKLLGSSEGDKFYGYKNFKSELRRACEALPADIEARVSDFSVEKLEWFAVFVSVPNWASNDASKKEEEADKADSDSTSTSNDTDGEPENDIPIENLRKQLGFSKKFDFSMRRFRFPLLRNVCKRTLWGNRNVLEVSCHIDNWFALCGGEDTSYMMKHVPWMEQKFLDTIITTETSCRVEENADLENCKFLCQMAILEPENDHFEKSTTFLGCSMEMLRSSLAKWAENAELQDESTWKPDFPNETRNAIDPFRASSDLTECLCNLDCISHLNERYIHMRVLWEVQNHLYKSLPVDGVGPSSVEAMLLCVLSFPALSINVVEARHGGATSRIRERREHCVIDLYTKGECKFEIEDYEYAIRAPCGPQNICVVVSFEMVGEGKKMLLSVRVCNDPEKTINVFHWQAWRDCFYGRLEGIRQWQEKLGIPQVPLLPTVHNIWTGIGKTRENAAGTGSSMNVWKGWIPPRAIICMYEMATPGFVMQAVKTKDVCMIPGMGAEVSPAFTVPQEVWMPVQYERAKAIPLKHASLVGQYILSSEEGDANADAVSMGLHDLVARAEQLLKDDLNNDGSLALLMLELAAVESGNTTALERAIGLLIGERCLPNAIPRALKILERFYFSKYGKSRTASLYRFFEDGNRVNVVKSLFEKLLERSNYDHTVAGRYMIFLLSMVNGPLHAGRTVLCKSLVLRAYQKQKMAAAFAIVDFAFTTINYSNEEFAAQYLACKNLMAMRDSKLPGYSIRRWKVAKADLMCMQGQRIVDMSSTEEGEIVLRSLHLNMQSAVDLYKRAVAEEHFAYAFIDLGDILRNGGNGLEKNAALAADQYQNAIDKYGNELGFVRLADLLFEGAEGLVQNVSRALKLYHRAIEEKRSVFAMTSLADKLISEKGNGVIEFFHAFQLYGRAIAEEKNSYAMHQLAYMLKVPDFGMQDIPRAIDFYERAIDDHESVEAMEELARLLFEGAEGLAPNVSRAMKLYHRAIEEKGSVNAMVNLADKLSDIGNSVVDYVHAFKLYERAIAKENNLDAMLKLAGILEESWYDLQDVPRAIHLYERAIEDHGSVEAMERLAGVLQTDLYGPKDVSRAVQLYQRAIEEESSTASTSLAKLLEGDEPDAEDVPRAMELYKCAIETYDPGAVEGLAGLCESQKCGVQDVPRALALYKYSNDEVESVYAMQKMAELFQDCEAGVHDVPRAVMLYEKYIGIYANGKIMEQLADLLSGQELGIQDAIRAANLYRSAIDEWPRKQTINKLALLLEKEMEEDLPHAVELYTRGY